LTPSSSQRPGIAQHLDPAGGVALADQADGFGVSQSTTDGTPAAHGFEASQGTTDGTPADYGSRIMALMTADDV
jgi:hypothetical protein